MALGIRKMPHSQEPRYKGTIYWSRRLGNIGDILAFLHTLDLVSYINPDILKSKTRKDITNLFS